MSRISFVALKKLINNTLSSRYQQSKTIVLSRNVQKQNLHLINSHTVKEVKQ